MLRTWPGNMKTVKVHFLFGSAGEDSLARTLQARRIWLHVAAHEGRAMFNTPPGPQGVGHVSEIGCGCFLR